MGPLPGPKKGGFVRTLTIFRLEKKKERMKGVGMEAMIICCNGGNVRESSKLFGYRSQQVNFLVEAGLVVLTLC